MAEKKKETDDQELELPSDPINTDPNPEDILPSDEPTVEPEPTSDSESEDEGDEEDDLIASAFFDILSDEGLDFLWDIVGELIDNEEVEDIPEETAPDADKQAWLDKNMDKVRKAFKAALSGE